MAALLHSVAFASDTLSPCSNPSLCRYCHLLRLPKASFLEGCNTTQSSSRKLVRTRRHTLWAWLKVFLEQCFKTVRADFFQIKQYVETLKSKKIIRHLLKWEQVGMQHLFRLTLLTPNEPPQIYDPQNKKCSSSLEIFLAVQKNAECLPSGSRRLGNQSHT